MAAKKDERTLEERRALAAEAAFRWGIPGRDRAADTAFQPDPENPDVYRGSIGRRGPVGTMRCPAWVWFRVGSAEIDRAGYTFGGRSCRLADVLPADLVAEIVQLVDRDYLDSWLTTRIPALGRRTPLKVAEDGDLETIREALYRALSGEPNS